MGLHASGEDYLEAILVLHFLHLTDVGREVAEQIYEKHRFFTDRLIEAGVDPETAERDACRIEHVISESSFQHLKRSVSGKR